MSASPSDPPASRLLNGDRTLSGVAVRFCVQRLLRISGHFLLAARFRVYPARDPAKIPETSKSDEEVFTVPIANTQELFVHELCEVYDAEHRFIEGQREMAQKATDGDLKGAIEDHITQTEQHARNLERIFSQLGQEPRRETNEVARGLVSEAQEGIQEARSDEIRDCLIDAAVIKVEHFEMGSYRSMVTGARLMGQTEAADLLKQNMQQEEETAQIAEQSAEELLRKAQRAEGREEGHEEGFIDKAKNKLSGQ